MLKAANEGRFNFIESVKEYGEKARIMKKLFTDNGFYIVYDQDDGVPIADGFYFTSPTPVSPANNSLNVFSTMASALSHSP